MPTSRGGGETTSSAKTIIINNPQRSAPQETEEPSTPGIPTLEPIITPAQRIWSTIQGTAETIGSNLTDAARAAYQMGQSARTDWDTQLRDGAQRGMEQAEYAMEILKQDGATQSELHSQQNIIDNYKRQLDAYSTVLDGEVQQRATQAAAQLSDELEQNSAYHFGTAKQGLGALGQFGIDTLAAGTQLAGMLAANQIVPGGAVILNALNSMGAETKNARQNGASLEQQLAAGVGNAALSLGTEKLFNLSSPMKNAYGPGLLDSPLARALEEVRTSTVGRVGLSALTEGGEEFAQALAQPILQRSIYDPNAEIDLGDAFYQGFVGAAVGGAADGVDVVISSAADAAFLSGLLGKEATQDPAVLYESLLQAKAYSEHDPISWVLVDAWDCGLQTKEEINDFYRDYLSYIGAENTSLYNIDKFLEAKYSNTKEFDLLRGYSNAVKKQDIPVLLGLDEYRAADKQIGEALIGVTTPTNVTIEGYGTHFIDRIIGNPTPTAKHKPTRPGVSISDVVDALQNPVEIGGVKIMEDGDIRQKFRGNKISVLVSIRDNRLIQVNPRKEKK